MDGLVLIVLFPVSFAGRTSTENQGMVPDLPLACLDTENHSAASHEAREEGGEELSLL